MKITIKHIMADAKLDFIKFRNEFRNSFDLKLACNNNLVVEPKMMSESDARKIITNGFDWGRLFQDINKINRGTIKFRILYVNLEGYKNYRPGSVTLDQKEITLNEIELKNAAMITLDLYPKIDFAINNLFYMIQYWEDCRFKLSYDM